MEDKIIALLNLPDNLIVKNKHLKQPAVSLRELLAATVSTNSREEATFVLKMSKSSYLRCMRKLFPDVKLHGSRQTWKLYVLSLLDSKKCNTCSEIKDRKHFTAVNGNQLDKHSNMCRSCQKNLRDSDPLLTQKQADSRERRKEYIRQYRIDNKGIIYASNAKYRAKKIRALPSWADLEAIKLIYNNCPKGYEVDHIVPLNGELVCGLHVENNLQYLTVSKNRSKGNKFIS